jgi:fatty acid desaturase
MIMSEITDVRIELYNRLPHFLQPLITVVCGKPYPGQRPTTWTSTSHAFHSLLTTFLGCMLAWIAWHAGWLWAVPSGWLLIVSGVRKMQVVVMHHCAHETVFASRWGNHLLGTAISIVLLVKAFTQYKIDHMAHHSNKTLLTESDETIQFLVGYARLEVGIRKEVLWRRLLLGLLSPFFHARWLLDRIAAGLCSKFYWHNLLALSYWIAVLWTIKAHHAWAAFAITWVFPITLFYNISATLRLAAEHTFPADEHVRQQRGMRFVCQATQAVFLASKPPRQGDMLGWCAWTGQMVGHVLARMLVLVGDTPCHDYHHRHPQSRHWVNYIFARQDDAAAGAPGFPEPYQETWGLIHTINGNLEAMSRVRRAANRQMS